MYCQTIRVETKNQFYSHTFTVRTFKKAIGLMKENKITNGYVFFTFWEVTCRNRIRKTIKQNFLNYFLNRKRRPYLFLLLKQNLTTLHYSIA